jgi:hypothetical protein
LLDTLGSRCIDAIKRKAGAALLKVFRERSQQVPFSLKENGLHRIGQRAPSGELLKCESSCGNE